jgi:chitinase
MRQQQAFDAAAFRVIGYQTDYSGSVSQIPFDKLTHVNYAFLLPSDSGDGSLQPLRSPAQLRELSAAAHANGIKALISVGGWNNANDRGFEILASDESSTARFVENMIEFAESYDLDGIDIDWEYPGPDAESARNYANLMKALSIPLRARGKLLTTAVVSLGPTGAGVLDEVFETIDFLNIMAYDNHDAVEHSSYGFAEQSLTYWLERGVPASKAVLGVPFYGRTPSTSYRKLVGEDAAAATRDASEYNGKTIHYNGVDTIKAKTNLAIERGSGIMIWELSEDTHDDTSLLTAISETIHHAAAERSQTR